MRSSSPALVLIALALASAPVRGQCQTDKLFASDAGVTAHFGHDVAADDGTLLVGALSAGVSGAVYAFESTPMGWTEVQKLLPSDAAYPQQFGSGVAVQGDLAVVGARADSEAGSLAGAAYVFERVGGVWVETQKLLASDAQASQYFGGAVALDGQRIVVGATAEQYAHEGAYIFERVGGAWVEVAKLNAPGPAISRDFGRDVVVRGSTVFVGAPLDPELGYASGAVFVYTPAAGAWTLQQKLSIAGAEAFDNLGIRIAVSGKVLWTSVDIDDIGPTAQTSVAVFEEVAGVWLERARFYHPHPTTAGGFGISLAARGGRVAVGSWLDDQAGPDAGAVFVYDFLPAPPYHVLTAELLPQDPQAAPALGTSVALSGERVIGGAQRDGTFGLQSGAAYVFDLAPTVTSYCTSAPNSAGPGALIDAGGSTSIAANAFTLELAGAPPGVLGLFYYGPATNSAPFGNGVSCVAPGATGVFRLTPAFLTSPAGAATRAVDFTVAPAGSGPGQVLPGSTWYFQAWYRDPAAGGAQFNLSDGLEASFCP